MAVVTANLPRPEQVITIDARELLGPEEYDRLGSAATVQGAPESLRACVVSKDPKITVVPHFLSEDECDHLVSLVDNYWMPSLVGQATHSTDAEYAKGDLENTLSKTRTSWSCMLRYAQTAVLERLEHRLAALAGLPVSQLERPNMVRYAPGELFDEHHDGKFRPVTVFVYLNDLPEGDDQGDTYFPYLGMAFRPRRGTAVMWGNAEASGDEDSRMLHAARAPRLGVKYGCNCFFNGADVRHVIEVGPDVPLEEAAIVRVPDLGAGRPDGPEPAEDKKVIAYRLAKDPQLFAVPGFATPPEVEHLRALALTPPAPSLCADDSQAASATDGPFGEGTRLLRRVAIAETETVEALERRLAGASGLRLECLAPLRFVRPGAELGLCNRGCGPKSGYVCLWDDGEEIFFPRLGIRIQLGPGDLVMWQNVDWETRGTAVEDVRTLRMHLRPEGAPESSNFGLDVFFHDNPLREQQLQRQFVADCCDSAAQGAPARA